jgi:hypothetical protein
VEIEAQARLGSVLDVCKHERRALEDLGDPRLNGVLAAMATLETEIAAALSALTERPSNGRPQAQDA